MGLVVTTLQHRHLVKLFSSCCLLETCPYDQIVLFQEGKEKEACNIKWKCLPGTLAGIFQINFQTGLWGWLHCAHFSLGKPKAERERICCKHMASFSLSSGFWVIRVSKWMLILSFVPCPPHLSGYYPDHMRACPALQVWVTYAAFLLPTPHRSWRSLVLTQEVDGPLGRAAGVCQAEQIEAVFPRHSKDKVNGRSWALLE